MHLQATFQSEENPPSVRLVIHQKSLILRQGLSGSGARYEAPEGLVFWIKGRGAALYEVRGEREVLLTKCAVSKGE